MSAIVAPRRLTCPRCGAGFDCTLSDVCWCARQPIGLPLPEADSGEECLCPDCFKAAAQARADDPPGSARA